eukprot:5661572-Prymnesium_polylepis.2
MEVCAMLNLSKTCMASTRYAVAVSTAAAPSEAFAVDNISYLRRSWRVSAAEFGKDERASAARGRASLGAAARWRPGLDEAGWASLPLRRVDRLC